MFFKEQSLRYLSSPGYVRNEEYQEIYYNISSTDIINKLVVWIALRPKGNNGCIERKHFFFRITFEVFPRILFCVILNEPLAYNFRSDFPGELFFKLTRLYDNKILWLIFLDSFIMSLRCIRVFREETLEPICCIFFFLKEGRNPDKNTYYNFHRL